MTTTTHSPAGPIYRRPEKLENAYIESEFIDQVYVHGGHTRTYLVLLLSTSRPLCAHFHFLRCSMIFEQYLLIFVIDQVAVVVPNREVLHNWLNGSAAPEAKVLARSLPCVCVRVCVCVCRVRKV
jgi:hypothetical protein